MITSIIVLVAIIAPMFIRPVRKTVWNIVQGSLIWITNQGPRVRSLIYSLLWLVGALILIIINGVLSKNTSILAFILALTFIPWFILVTITSISKKLRPIERNLGLIFMFFTPIVVFLMGDMEVATSQLGIGAIGAYATFCFFFTAIAKFTGKITDAPAYFLTFCFLLTLWFVGYKNIAPKNYQAHKLAVLRWNEKNTIDTYRNSFPNSLIVPVTYATVTEQAPVFTKKGDSLFRAMDGKTFKTNEKVVIIDHGKKAEVWHSEKMFYVQRQDKYRLFAGELCWIPGKFLEKFQPVKKISEKPEPIAQTTFQSRVSTQPAPPVINLCDTFTPVPRDGKVDMLYAEPGAEKKYLVQVTGGTIKIKRSTGGYEIVKNQKVKIIKGYNTGNQPAAYYVGGNPRVKVTLL